MVNFLFRHHTNSVSLATNPRDENGLQLQNVRRTLSSSVPVSGKNPWKTYGLHSLRQYTWYLPLGVPGALCAREGIDSEF